MRQAQQAKLVAAATAVGLLAAGLTGLAGAASASGESAESAAGTKNADTVPAGFEPVTSSWTSTDSGYVAGTAPCDGNRFCQHLLATDDGGQTWTEQDLPALDEHQEVTALRAVSNDGTTTTLITVEGGNNGALMYASYDGSDWQRETLGDDQAFVMEASVIGESAYVLAYNNVFQVGGLYRSPVGTDQWERVRELPRPWYYGGQLSERDDSAILSTAELDGAKPLATTTDGNEWTDRASKCGESSDGYPDSSWVAAGGTDTMYLICEPYYTDEPAKVFASSDDGATFSKVGTLARDDEFNELTDLAAVGDTLVAAADDPDGDDASGGCRLASSSDGGQSWERTLTVEGQVTPTDLEFTDENHGTMVCRGRPEAGVKGADVYRTTDGGRTWQPLGLHTQGPDPTEWFDPVSSSWPSERVGYLFGWAWCEEQKYCAALLRTDDGGQTWSEQPAPDVPWIDTNDKELHLEFVERDGERVGLLYAARDNSRPGNQVFATYDGKTWQREDFGLAKLQVVDEVTATSSYVYAMANVGEYADYKARLMRTPVGTDEWERVPNIGSDGGYSDGTVDARGDTAVAVAGDKGRVWTTTDGSTWTERDRPCDPGEQQISMAGGADRIYAACNPTKPTGRRFFASDDGGATFTKVSNTPRASQYGDGTAAGDTVLLGFQTGCRTRASGDGGSSWHGADAKSDGSLLALGSTDDGTGFAVCGVGRGIGGGLAFRTTDNGRSWERLPLTTS